MQCRRKLEDGRSPTSCHVPEGTVSSRNSAPRWPRPLSHDHNTLTFLCTRLFMFLIQKTGRISTE